MLALFTGWYFHINPGGWTLYLALFFVPDLSFFFYLLHKKAGTIAYNIFHHQGLFAMQLLFALLMHQTTVMHYTLIFLAHSAFDRALGYGLKYPDSFDHTHLGWIGKSKHKNTGTI